MENPSIAVRLIVNWAGEVYLDHTVPWLGLAMIITLPFKHSKDPNEKTQNFVVRAIGQRADLDPPTLEAHVENADLDGPPSYAEFIASGWKHGP